MLISSFPAHAQTIDYFDLPLAQLLGAEVVSVSKKPQKLAQSPAAVYVITGEDIIRSGVTNIPDALRMAPGVQVAQADSNSWAISIRGFNNVLAKRLLVMIDGRTIYNTLHGGVYWEAHNVAMGNIDRIEIVRGPGGSLWGANAVNGVINIIMKKSYRNQGTRITAGYGSHERGLITVNHGGSFADDKFYNVYARYFDRDNYRNLSGTSANDEWEGYRAGWRTDWGDYLSISGDIYRSGADQNFERFSLTPPFETADSETAVNKGGNITGNFRKPLENGAEVSLRTYFDYASRDENILSDERYIFDIETQYNFQPLGRHEFIAGAGVRNIRDDLAGTELTVFSPASREDFNFSGFLQDRIIIVPDEWDLTLGSKFEHNFYTGFEFQPTARLQWLPDEDQTVWASVSRAVSTPTRIERDLDITNLVVPPGLLSPTPALVTLANNKSFDSEKMIAYELGYRNRITSGLSLDAALFYNEYHDMLSVEAAGVTPVAGPPAHVLVPLVARNDQSAETYGGELVLNWNVNSEWKLTGAYSYLEVFVHAPDVLGFSQELEEDDAPAHQASIQSSWNISKTLNLDTNLYYVDSLPRFGIGDYVRLDASLGWRIHKNVRFNLVGQNLAEEAHREWDAVDSVNAAEIERSVFGNFTWEF